MLGEDRLGQLRQAKLRGLVRGAFGVEGESAAFRSGATLLAESAAYVLVDEARVDSLGGAVVWFVRQHRGELHLIVDGGDDLEVVAGVLARQATQFALDITVWRVEDRALVRVEPAPVPGPPAAAPSGAADLVAMLEVAGVDIVVEHGVIKGEVLGLEVARVTTGATGPVLEVGVGRFDREMAALMHADLPTAEALAKAVAMVREHRHDHASRHPLRDLVPERWVRTRVVEDPSLVGAAALTRCDTTVEPANLRVRQPAAAIGIDDAGAAVLVVCSVGVDVDLVPLAADTRAWLAPDAELVLAIAMRGVPPVVADLAASLVRPARVVELEPLF